MEGMFTRSGKRLCGSEHEKDASQTRLQKRLRKDTERFLVGQPISSISGSKLPSKRQVLQYLFHVRDAGSSKHQSTVYHDVLAEVVSFWKTARIETLTMTNCKKRCENLFSEWRSLQKNRSRTDDAWLKRKESFESQLDTLFDIGADDAIGIIQSSRLLSEKEKEIDIAFYKDQQGPRQATLSGKDKIFQKKVASKIAREDKSGPKPIPSTSRQAEPIFYDDSSSSPSVAPAASDDTSDSIESLRHEAEKSGKETSSKLITVNLPKNVLQSPTVAEMADRLQLSNRQVSYEKVIYSHKVD